MFLQGHKGDSVLLPWLQPRLVEGGDAAGELGDHTTLIILSGNETSINPFPPARVAWRGGAPHPSTAHSASPDHIVTLAHPTIEEESWDEVTQQAWSTRVVGLQNPPHPSSLPSFCILPFVPLLFSRTGKMIKPKPWLDLFSLLLRCQEPFVVDVEV